VLFSFYMLGQKMGLLYSTLNVVPVVVFMVLQFSNAYALDQKPEKVEQSTIILCILSSFILIIFIHSQFYTAFLKSIRQLKETGDEQNALNHKYEIAIEKAEKSFEAKSEFLSTMSHEIRTPLNAVIGMSNLLIMGGPRPDQKENLEVLKFSAGNLLSIVNDVLDFNKIESGKLIFENAKFNLVDLMLNICGGQMMTAQEKGLLFNLDVDPLFNQKLLFGDPTRITQVIFNLVSNAIKFTPKGGIWVKATCLEDRHNIVVVNFSVKDSGIGIAKENVSSIFEPFTQESVSTTRQYGGTGLGLAIVKRLLELQGLKIQVSSKPDAGSEFSFNMEFPVSTEKISEPTTSSNSVLRLFEAYPADNLGALRVLVAEDNLVNVMLMKKLLSKWGIVPSVAENGERAIELVQYGNFDIILMDLQMPVMNGFDATIEIRKMPDPRKANIPIIALTASALYDIKERVYVSGMNGYVSKPFKPGELLEKIQSLTVAVL
jgi:signal transduction histidine kinase